MSWQLPNLARLNAQMASQNRRVNDYLDGVLGRLDRLIDAALAHDWEGVRRWSREISECGQAHHENDILQSAQSVLEVIDGPEDESELKRRVMRLIAACGRAQSRAKMP
jgi:hypothetical protein